MASRYRDPFYTPEPENYHVPVPKQSRAETSRDERLQIRTLFFTAGWEIDQILLQFSPLTRDQVDYALETRPTPQKKGHCGRHVKLNTPYRKQLVKWMTTDQSTRDTAWKDIPKYPGWENWCGEKAIRQAFAIEGYGRRVKRRKPPLSEKNQKLRLAWAQEHLNWSNEQWDLIIWSEVRGVPPCRFH